MTRIQLAPEVAEDFQRILDHLQQHDSLYLADRLGEIIAAIDVLQSNPLIGRPANNHKRELIIGRGPNGYVALYRYLPTIDTAFVLAVRAQREAGYRE